MSHAEKCPLCGGNGNMNGMDENVGGTTPFCLGCCGKGWIEVRDETPHTVPLQAPGSPVEA